MELLKEVKNEIFFILDDKITMLIFDYNEKDDTFSINEGFAKDSIVDKCEILGETLRFSKWTISKSGEKYEINLNS